MVNLTPSKHEDAQLQTCDRLLPTCFPFVSGFELCTGAIAEIGYYSEHHECETQNGSFSIILIHEYSDICPRNVLHIDVP